MLIPHLGFSDSIYYEAIYEFIVYFVQYVVVVPIVLLLFRVILGRKIGWNLKDSYRKPQASGGQLFRWCLIALGLVYATSMASHIFFNLFQMVTDVELQSPSMVAEENWVGYLNNIVAFSLYAPIFEEMLFRATLFRNTERFGSWFGVITIGITFGLWHCNYEQFFYTAVLGICAAFLTAKTRSVLPAMAIHFTMNFIGAMQSIAYSGLDLDNLDLEVMLQHPLKMLLLAGMNFLVIGILIAGCVLFIVELVKHRETFRLGNTVPQVSGGKKALDKYKNSPAITLAMREATHRVMYAVSRTHAMNGRSASTKVVPLTPWWRTTIDGMMIGFGVLTAAAAGMLITSIVMRKKSAKQAAIEE